jgi:hypothetical protein
VLRVRDFGSGDESDASEIADAMLIHLSLRSRSRRLSDGRYASRVVPSWYYG